MAKKTAKKAKGPDGVAAVNALLDARRLPLRADIDWVRGVIRGARPGIVEEVKWNTSSFRVDDFFATIHLRSADGVLVVLHSGTKKKGVAFDRETIRDPRGLMRWLDPERGLVTLGAGSELRKRRAALTGLVRDWVTELERVSRLARRD